MFGPKVKLEKGLYDRLKEIAESGGYSSVDEFIVTILEKEAEKFAEAENTEQLQERLRGLGYIE